MAVFYDSCGTGAVFDEHIISFPIPIDLFWTHQTTGSETAVVAAITYEVAGANLSDLQRRCWYGSVEMKSLGVKAFGQGDASHGWTELFGLIRPPRGRQIMHAWINGGALLVGKAGRGNSVSYSGVDGFGPAVLASGSAGGAQTVSVTGDKSTAVVAGFGSATVGLNSFNQRQRYLSNTAMALLIGDADGTGSAVAMTANRAKAGDWSAVGVTLTPADIIATGQTVVATPAITATGRRYPRPGTNRRLIIPVTPEN